MSQEAIESVLEEKRVFAPPAAFAAEAHVASLQEYQEEYARSIEDPEAFWADIARELHWFEPWDKVLDDSEKPFFKWFVGGKTNLCYNCVDRHLQGATANKAAIIWEGEPGDERVLTYRDLHREVCIFANTLKSLGITKGDKVALYLPMIPELAIAVLACARIGAVHSVIFAGFSAESIKDRVLDADCKMVITGDGGWRRGKPLPLKSVVDAGIADCACVENVLVVARNPRGERFDCEMQAGRDVWYHEASVGQSRDCPCEELDSEDLLFLLYTSGSTGKPKGIMHTVGGYSVYTYLTAQTVFDLKPEDVYWCTADVGWITGHSYILYGPLQNAATVVMYEGAPNFPDPGRFWDVVDKYKVTIFYTAPTAIRAFMKWGDEWVDKYSLSSLRLLGSVGEPINPEAWMWYHDKVGKERCPIVDTWWQTETGGHMLTPLPGATTTTPGSCTRPMLGIDAAVCNEDGTEVPQGTGGILVIRKPWPSMLRGVYGDRARFLETYWSKVDGYYTAGDGARIDENGNFWIMGRIDDVIIVAGHNIGTMEVESALVSHPRVAEAAVVGYPHEIKGNGIAAFCILRGGEETGFEDVFKDELRDHVAQVMGPVCKPDKIVLTDALPKTRSGKIMRRLLRDIAAGNEIKQDTTTLEDRSIVEKLQAGV